MCPTTLRSHKQMRKGWQEPGGSPGAILSHSQFGACLTQREAEKGTCESCWDALKSLEGPRVSAEMAAAPAAALNEAHFGAALADTRA